MKDLVYYPGFDVKNEKWLKFALLYLDKIRPIIPNSGLSYVHSSTKSIINNTDLIEPIDPSRYYSEIGLASNRAMNLFEDFLRYPERFISHYRKKSKLREDMFISRFTDKDNQTYTLFLEKYSYPFHRYCIEHNLAHESRDFLSLNISKELAHVYMSLLADEMAIVHKLDSITDDPLANELILGKTRDSHLRRRLEIISRSLELEIPKEINEIEIDKIIELRSNPKFNDVRKIYADKITKYLDTAKPDECNYYLNHSNIFDCHDEYRYILFTTLGISASIMVAIESFGIGVASIASAVGLAFPEFKNAKEKIQQNKSVKRYFAELKNLGL